MSASHSKRPTGRRGCAAHTKAGNLCDQPAVDGTDLCRIHPGRPLAEHKARGAVVTAIRRWGIDDLPEDPGLLLLKLTSITEWNRQGYEAEIDRIITEGDYRNLSDALVGESVVVDKNGSPHVVGEYVRGIVQLEQAERKLAAELSIKALAANVAERQVRLAEQQGQLVAKAIRLVLADLGHDVASPEVLAVVSTRLAALGGA